MINPEPIHENTEEPEVHHNNESSSGSNEDTIDSPDDNAEVLMVHIDSLPESQPEAIDEENMPLQLDDELQDEVMEGEVGGPEDDTAVPDPSVQSKGTCTTPLSVKLNYTKCSPRAEEEGQICTICFEEWTNSGNHRLVSLRCGHLFGQSCISRWLRGSGSRCPQCNVPAKRHDIRRIYVKNLKVLDTAERDQALKELEAERELRRKMEFEMAKLKLKCDLAVQECERLKAELMKYKEWAKNARSTNAERKSSQITQDSEPVSFLLEKTIELCKDGGCRILTASDFLNLLIISQPSSTNLFPGYGIKKLSTLDFRMAEFVSIHQKPIKDVAFHSHDALVLTASLDRTTKLTNVISNTVVQTYTLPLEAWSCAWSKENPCHFFTGLRNGDVFQFDTRMTSSHVCQLPAMGHKSPVVSLQYIQKQLRDTGFSVNGLLSGQLSTCCLYEMKQDSDYRVHPLPLEGNFTSLSYEPSTGHLLVSCRPSSKHSTVTHMLCELKFDRNVNEASISDSTCSCNVVQVMTGGDTQAQLSKSGLFIHPSNESSVLACAGDEKAQAALIWDACTGEYLQQLKVNDAPVFDVQFFRANQSHLLGTLTEKCLRIYKWNG